MATDVLNIFLTRKEKLKCKKCFSTIKKGEKYVAKTENHKGLCFNCSLFIKYSFLPAGNAAMSRRSKKFSQCCGVLQQWNQKRKRYERKGIYVELSAILKAKQACEEDKEKRLIANKKAALKRAKLDEIYIHEFAKAIKTQYPNCPLNRNFEIAKYACEKYSGRVGRTANAKQFDNKMIDLAVEAHIRHTETNYDNEFGKGIGKKQIRYNVKSQIEYIMLKWKKNT